MSEHSGVEGFETWVECSPSFYLIRDEPAKNYGVGNMRIWFYLKGPKGAIQWQIGTAWGIKPVREHLERFGWSSYEDPRQPRAWDLGYHSHEPLYDGATPMGSHCEIIGGTCYYDGSSLNAEKLTEGFLAGGTKWLWPTLAAVYRHYFEGAEWPDFSPTYEKHPDDIAALSRAEQPK